MERLQELRKLRGINQLKLSEQLDVSRSTISMWETGASQPDNDTLRQLAEILDTTTDYLLGLTDDPNTKKPTPASAEIGFNDFTYALHEESKELTESQKQSLLDMARFFKSQLDKEGK